MTARPERSGRWRTPLRWLARLALVLLALPVLLAIAGAVYQSVRGARDRQRYPPAGKLVDAGGHRLHLYCVGDGMPTVVLESAHGGTWLDWVLVQPEVSAFTRVCAYDRAGTGWSDPGPPPRTSRRVAAEVHTALAQAGERPPYVLVGHSIGGHHVRAFAHLYPDEVAGVVLVDAAHEEMLQRLSPETVGQVESLAGMLRWFRYAMVVGAPRLLGLCGQVPAGLERFQGAQTFIQCRASFIRTMEQELDALDTDAAEVAAAGDLGDRPLVVVSRDFTLPDPALPPEVAERDRVAGVTMQQELARLSTAGWFVMAERSGHYVQLDRPDLVIQAVREVVAAAR